MRGICQGIAEADIEDDRNAGALEIGRCPQANAAIFHVFANCRGDQRICIEYQSVLRRDRHDLGENLFQGFLIGFAEAEEIGIRSEEHTSELQSLMRISYAVFCLKKKTTTKK